MFDSRFLRRKLVLPLAAATGVALALGWLVPAGGLFVNLATTFVGILLTVGYVDLVLREHQSRRWLGALTRIHRRLDNFATVASTQFRIAFGFTPDVYDERVIWSPDDRVRREELVRVARHVLRPVSHHRIGALDTRGWKRLCQQLRISWNSADRLIELYAGRLEPDIIAAIIDIQDRMRALMDRYSTFPDVLGILDAELEPNRKEESSLPLRKHLEGASAEDVCAILDLTCELFAYLDRGQRGQVGVPLGSHTFRMASHKQQLEEKP